MAIGACGFGFDRAAFLLSVMAGESRESSTRSNVLSNIGDLTADYEF